MFHAPTRSAEFFSAVSVYAQKASASVRTHAAGFRSSVARLVSSGETSPETVALPAPQASLQQRVEAATEWRLNALQWAAIHDPEADLPPLEGSTICDGSGLNVLKGNY